MPAVQTFLFLLAAVLAIVGAFARPPRVSLGWLAVGVLAIAFMLPGVAGGFGTG
jgi:hypothetical protein